jgi:hypothetical protein
MFTYLFLQPDSDKNLDEIIQNAQLINDSITKDFGDEIAKVDLEQSESFKTQIIYKFMTLEGISSFDKDSFKKSLELFNLHLRDSISKDKSYAYLDRVDILPENYKDIGKLKFVSEQDYLAHSFQKVWSRSNTLDYEYLAQIIKEIYKKSKEIKDGFLITIKSFQYNGISQRASIGLIKDALNSSLINKLSEPELQFFSKVLDKLDEESFH